MSLQPLKILLVDDHLLLAEALASLIEARFPEVELWHAASLGQALAQLDEDKDESLDLVLLDLGLPDASGLQALQRIRAQAPGLRLVVLSADDRAETVQAAIELGASGFVPKQASSQQLLQALVETLQGGINLPANLLATAPPMAGPPELTPRQHDVLQLLLQGRSNKLICRQLGLSESSVKTHLEAVYRRLGVSSRTQAVVQAARLGLKLKTPAQDASRR
ncbi:DNA-binding NarL/FixJ family response regulator [Paucibacter oligotrophus]|uniref:DNA-binding NarL/FixJ family response regulator n=1 Tax=Roseateles oligotrophus TaxID=1769250 RepID=A0A840LA09_9BURK|nr:response regulator transcription factor [Roseateles oligotrophus]MBB4845414.1 DNA-binding NarL/FixJ family response regulator [Roseateles oligotrophus]